MSEDVETTAAAATPAAEDRSAAAAEAARQALLDAGVDLEDGAPPPDKKSEPVEKPKAEPAATEPDLRSKVMLRAKMLAQDAQEKAAAKIAEAEARIAEAERIKAQYEPVRGQLEKLRTKPREAIRELGLAEQKFFDSALEEAGEAADPTKVLERRLEALQAKIDAQAEEAKKREEEAKKAEAERNGRAQVQELLQTVSAAPEKFPMLHKRYASDAEELVWRAARVERQYYASDHYKRTGERIAKGDVAEFLEQQEAALYGSNSGQPPTGAATPPATGKSGPRSLSTATTSQRATVSADLKAMTPEERRERAASEAARALREYGKGSNDD